MIVLLYVQKQHVWTYPHTRGRKENTILYVRYTEDVFSSQSGYREIKSRLLVCIERIITTSQVVVVNGGGPPPMPPFLRY